MGCVVAVCAETKWWSKVKSTKRRARLSIGRVFIVVVVFVVAVVLNAKSFDDAVSG